MTPDQVFLIANTLALAAWLLLIVLPRQRWMADLVARWVMPGAFAAMYVAIVATQWAGRAGGFATLVDVARLFSQPWLLPRGGSTTSRSICSSAAGKCATRATAAYRISPWRRVSR